MVGYVQRALLASLLCLSTGCMGHQVKKDGIQFRNAVIDLYTEQAVDNLIRARCHMPFVQLQYHDLTITDTKDASADASTDQSISTTRDLFVAGASRLLTNAYHLGGSTSLSCQMSFTADPVILENDIYEKYLAFANDPSLLVESDSAPPCPVHIYRKCGKKHYWIPVEAGQEFLDLVLKTSLMRGPETVPQPPAAYEVTITVEKVEKDPDPNRDILNASLLFDKPIPNGPATMVVDLSDGRRVRVNLYSVSKDREGNRVDLGQPTLRLDAQWGPKKMGFTADNLNQRPARVYSHDYPPEAPTPVPTIRRIATNVNRIRMDQLRQKP